MAYTQEDVNNWFTANPNATPEFVAQTVQKAGGLDANPGIAGMIGQHYGTDANTITAGYNSLIAPTAPALQASPVTPVVQPVAAPIATPVATTPPVVSQFQTNVNTWKENNPTATPQQMANAIAANGGLTPEMARAVAQAYDTDVNTITTGYNQFNPYSQIESLYKNKDYTGINSLIGQSGLTTEQIQNQFGLTNEQLNQARDLGINLNYMTPEIQRLVESTLADEELSPTLQINKILETGQKYGFGESDLEKLYGKETIASALDTYKKGINQYLTETLATDPTKTTLNEVGEIHRAAQKYGMTPDEIAKYGGMDVKTAQSYFDAYDQGLVNLMTALKDPQYSETQRTAIALDAAQKYGTTDAELAKASKGKYTEKDIAEYLDPVRNVPTNLSKLFADPNATAKDINKFITEAKADPRAAGIYGAALDKVANNPELYWRDATSGKADISDSYEAFLTKAKATPEMAAKYAPQINAVEQAKKIIGTHALRRDFGGEYRDYAMQMFLGLDKDAVKQAPKALEMTAPTTKKATAMDPETGGEYTYDVTVPAALKPGQKGIEPVWSGEAWGDGTYAPSEITGYRKKVDADDFSRQPVYATYDTKGNLTGYESDARVHTADRTYYGAKWNADGSPAPYGVTKSRGGFGGFLDSFAELGPIGTIALMAATGGLGSLAAGALANTAVGATLGTIGTNAVASGLVSGALSEMGGGDFGKGFVGGAVGSGVGNLTSGMVPTNMTGMPIVDTYLAQALPKAAGAVAGTAATGGDVGDAGLYSLLNTGVNMGTNSLLQNSGIGTLPASVQPYATGVASNLVSSALTGKDPDLEKALIKTVGQQAMQAGKSAVKTAAKP